MSKLIHYLWYKKNILSYFLLPLSLIYLFVIFVRRLLYKINFFKTHRISVPVIIVGNITAGGTGKTPLVIALVDALKKNGFHPGIITRGYGGKSKVWPQTVDENSDPALVGDEAVLMAKKTGVPVVAGPSRVEGAARLIKSVDVIISDDGLQHYALERDIEIVVIDSTRNCGNGFCLPAGPLRESKKRLNSVDFIIMNGSGSDSDHVMQFVIDDITNIHNGINKLNPIELQNKKIIAIAAIGNPDRFFSSLRELKIAFETRVFPDHYFFQEKDFKNLSCDIILMTEKDAVKCTTFADERFYKVCGHALVNNDLIVSVIKKLRGE